MPDHIPSAGRDDAESGRKAPEGVCRQKARVGQSRWPPL